MFSGGSEQFYSTTQFSGSKMLKSTFLKKKGLKSSFFRIEVWVVTNMSNRHESESESE